MPWLMKAEPDSRIVKGKDVKFSVDDLEEIGTSPWDGVRNHEAKNIMKDKMKLGDKVLFYHSNCKVPGVYALAEVVKEGYPDYTAWDPSHPYYDARSKEESPTWYMVSVRFVRRLAHPVTLGFIKSTLVGADAPPPGVEYIGADGLKAIQGMALVNRGRLSVQPVEDAAYDAIVLLGDKGGWDESAGKGKKRKADGEPKAEKKAKAAGPKVKAKTKGKVKDERKSESESELSEPPEPKPKAALKGDAKPKREAKPPPPAPEGTRRSARIRK